MNDLAKLVSCLLKACAVLAITLGAVLAIIWGTGYDFTRLELFFIGATIARYIYMAIDVAREA